MDDTTGDMFDSQNGLNLLKKGCLLAFRGKKKKKNLNKKGKSNRKNKKKVGKRPGLPDGPEHPTSWLNTQTKGRRPKIIVQNSLSIH